MKKNAGIDIANLDIEFYCNDDRSDIVIEIVDQEENPFLFEGCTAKLQIKKRSSDSNFVKELNTEDSSILLENGRITLKFSKAKTSVSPGNYLYDLEITQSSGSTFTLLKGEILAIGDITR